MSVDPASVWYIARNGEIVWQGTANELLNWVETGGIQGSEAAWSEGFPAWVPVHLDPKTYWIRQAVAHRDERTGEPTEFSNPEGTEALHLPSVAEEGDSPFAGPRPSRNQVQSQAKRTAGLPLGLVAGVLIGIGVATSLWSNEHPPTSATTKRSQGVGESSKANLSTATPVSKPRKAATPTAPTDDEGQTDAAAVEPSEPKSTTKTRKRLPAPEASVLIENKVKSESTSSTTTNPPKQKGVAPTVNTTHQAIRIIQKKKTSVKLPQDSANRAEEIQRSMKVRKGVWDACIRRAQKDYPALVGRLVFTISVTKDGVINGVAGPRGNQGAQYAAACLLGEFDNLTFPPGRAAQVQFPYTTP